MMVNRLKLDSDQAEELLVSQKLGQGTEIQPVLEKVKYCESAGLQLGQVLL